MSRIAVALFAMLACLAPAAAQTTPYAPASATLKPVTPEPALLALIEKIRENVEAGELAAVDAALAPDFILLACPADPLADCAPGAPNVRASDPRIPAAKRLRDGLCCADVPAKDITDPLRVETVTGLLAGALEAEGFGQGPQPGEVCLPPWPIYDRAAAGAIARAGGGDALLLRYATEPVTLREKPEPAAPAIHTLEMGAIAPMLMDVSTQMPDGWYAVLTPSGAIGYADTLGLNELTAAGLCFRKAGAMWKIARFVVRE